MRVDAATAQRPLDELYFMTGAGGDVVEDSQALGNDFRPDAVAGRDEHAPAAHGEGSNPDR